jgi:hypothetical protein
MRSVSPSVASASYNSEWGVCWSVARGRLIGAETPTRGADMTPPDFAPLADVVIDPVVVGLPRADLRIHTEAVPPQLGRVLARRQGRGPYERSWAPCG